MRRLFRSSFDGPRFWHSSPVLDGQNYGYAHIGPFMTEYGRANSPDLEGKIDHSAQSVYDSVRSSSSEPMRQQQ